MAFCLGLEAQLESRMHDTERIICVLSVFHALLTFQNVEIVAFVANRSFFSARFSDFVNN